MRSIQAQPKTLQEIFKDIYNIPDFQRPYTWNIDTCEQLWEDIYEAFKSFKENEKYFLGSIVVYSLPEGGEGSYEVVDGQQRLTTLLLLLKAMYDGFTGIQLDSLKQVVFQRNTITSEYLVDENDEHKPRITFDGSQGDGNEQLKETLKLEKNSSNKTKDNKFQENYQKLYELLSDSINSNISLKGNPQNFVGFVLQRVVLLPIICEDLDDALTIFQTVNNRGESLSEIDIFKAMLLKKAKEKKDPRFIERWEGVINSKLHKELNVFRLYMRILRGKKNDDTSEVGLKRFFTKDEPEYFRDYNQVLSDLEHIIKLSELMNGFDGFEVDYETYNLFQALKAYPNDLPLCLIYVFLFRSTSNTKDLDKFDKKTMKNLNALLRGLLAFSYSSGVVYGTVSKIKPTIFKLMREDSLSNLDSALKILYDASGELAKYARKKVDQAEVKGNRYLRGILTLLASLNKFQKCRLPEKLHIEHILPQRGFKYLGWDDEQAKERLDRLGNLVLIESKINIKASNNYFKLKQDEWYKNSKIADVKSLKNYDSWLIDQFEDRHKKSLNKLENFWKGKA